MNIVRLRYIERCTLLLQHKAPHFDFISACSLLLLQKLRHPLAGINIKSTEITSVVILTLLAQTGAVITHILVCLTEADYSSLQKSPVWSSDLHFYRDKNTPWILTNTPQ